MQILDVLLLAIQNHMTTVLDDPCRKFIAAPTLLNGFPSLNV